MYSMQKIIFSDVHGNHNVIYSEHDYTQYTAESGTTPCLNVSEIPLTSVHHADDKNFHVD
jgi:hypothetical protein